MGHAIESSLHIVNLVSQRYGIFLETFTVSYLIRKFHTFMEL